MGWKKIKEHYKITHLIHAGRGRILVGSGYIHEILEILPDGRVNVLYSSSNEDIIRYVQQMTADSALLARLYAEEDSFDINLTVYSFDGATIVEQCCEAYGWPNVTHAGELMYDNTHFQNKEEAVAAAKRNASAAVEFSQRRLEEAKRDLRQLEADLDQFRANLATLDSTHPAPLAMD